VLLGGEGLDAFVFNAPLNPATNVDRIRDFNVAEDTVWLSDNIFRQVGPVGPLSADAFHIGSSAADASDRIVYNDATGALYYDRDGNGSAQQVQFARLSPGLTLTGADFLIY
jgi:Ca2+-binding RTX toxin-like protein